MGKRYILWQEEKSHFWHSKFKISILTHQISITLFQKLHILNSNHIFRSQGRKAVRWMVWGPGGLSPWLHIAVSRTLMPGPYLLGFWLVRARPSSLWKLPRGFWCAVRVKTLCELTNIASFQPWFTRRGGKMPTSEWNHSPLHEGWILHVTWWHFGAATKRQLCFSRAFYSYILEGLWAQLFAPWCSSASSSLHLLVLSSSHKEGTLAGIWSSAQSSFTGFFLAPSRGLAGGPNEFFATQTWIRSWNTACHMGDLGLLSYPKG